MTLQLPNNYGPVVNNLGIEGDRGSIVVIFPMIFYMIGNEYEIDLMEEEVVKKYVVVKQHPMVL